jgi:hypothetical protein
MTHKVLIITAGTIAAGVGEEFIKQITNHKSSEIQFLVRYLDTAHLPTHYSSILDGEWTQMTIEPRFIDSVRRDRTRYPYLKDLLYSDLLPTIQGSGAGSIRYNAACAVSINHDKIKRWLKTAINQLVSSDKGQVDLSIAVVVSAVGATGGGSLERLVNIIVETAQDANLPEPLHCDVFIMQPGIEGVTDLGQANTLALYAEMAATRLSQNDVSIKSNRGRTIAVGWGSQSRMASIEQLKEAIATLIRVTHDPSTDIAAEFQEREVDNHVLRQPDTQTGLPSHLSSATAVTISLGGLEEKIIQRDAARLIDNLVFGGVAAETTSGEYMVANTTNRKANILLSILSSFLRGENPEIRYRSLLQRLREAINTRSLQITAAQIAQTPNAKEQASMLRGMWQADKVELVKIGRQKIGKKGAELATNAINEMLQTRLKQMGTSLSLKELRDDYLELDSLLEAILKIAEDAEHVNSRQVVQEDESIIHRIEALEKSTRFNRQSALEQALGAVQNDLRNEQRREVTPIATEVLKELMHHVAESLRNLNLTLNKLNKQRKTNLIWASADKPLRIDIDHPLHLTALTGDEEIRKYANRVSVFDAASRAKTTTVGRLMAGEGENIDPIAEFRKWMEDTKLLDALFKGDVDLLLNLALTFARKYVHKEVEKNSVIEVILETDEAILLQRLKEAATSAHSLVSFSEQFAPDNREARLVSAYYDKDEERAALLGAINKAFGQGNCQLVKSRDRTEVVVFYYVDGLPLSAINDLSGRCLNAFLKRRYDWYQQQKLSLNGKTPRAYNQFVGVPVYSGQDAENRVLETGIVKRVYQVKRLNVKDYSSDEIDEIPELKDLPEDDDENANGANGSGDSK